MLTASLKDLYKGDGAIRMSFRSTDGLKLSQLSGGPGIPGALSLPHPAATETLAALEDQPLLELCEKLNATGQMVVYGEDLASSWDAAMLLAGYFRIWPTEMRPRYNLCARPRSF